MVRQFKGPLSFHQATREIGCGRTDPAATRFCRSTARCYSAAAMLFSIALVLLSAATPVRLQTTAAARANTIGPRALTPGQKAVVKTVFEGSRIESFEAEIVGVIEGGRAGGDVILGRATAGRALETGVAQGMSGSPVYVDGKLIGALSLGWPFSREPLFGITPIGEMLEVFDHPIRAAPNGTAGPSGAALGRETSGTSFRGVHWGQAETDLPNHAEANHSPGQNTSAPGVIGLSRLLLPLASSGLNPAALEIVRDWLGPFHLSVVPGGASPAVAPGADQLEPGSAVAVDLLRGDLRFAGLGTLTYRDGDRLLMFGHPLFQSGEVRLPLSTATIATVLSSQLVSFKMGSSGEPVGLVTQDRRTAVAARLGEPPTLMPLSVTVRGARPTEQRFRFETIEDAALAPTLIAIAGLNSLLESGGVGGNQTVRWTMKLHRSGAAPLSLSDVAADPQPAITAALGMLAPLALLYGNPFQPLNLDSVAITIEAGPGRDEWTLREAHVLDAAVRPGGSLRVRCVLDRYRGESATHVFTVRVPEEVPDGRYLLWVGGGDQLTRFEAKQLPARYRPTSLEDAWQRLATSRSSDGLYAALYARAPEVTLGARDYPELPLSALALLKNTQRRTTAPESGQVAKLDEIRLPINGATKGQIQTQVLVDSKAP